MQHASVRVISVEAKWNYSWRPLGYASETSRSTSHTRSPHDQNVHRNKALPKKRQAKVMYKHLDANCFYYFILLAGQSERPQWERH